MELRAVFELLICMAFPILLTAVLVLIQNEREKTSSVYFAILAGVLFGISAIFG